MRYWDLTTGFVFDLNCTMLICYYIGGKLDIMEQLYYLQKLFEILKPKSKVFDTGNEAGWKQLELSMNIVFPIDYKEYIKTYGTGCIDNFLWVLNPFCDNENINFIQKGRSLINAYKILRRSHSDIYKYHIFPEKNGLLPWGFTDNGDELYWETGLEPDKWNVVVCKYNFYNYRMCMTEFLYKIISREIICDEFPEDFPDQNVEFSVINTNEIC